MSPPSTAVVVVNWNGADDTRQCLRSLAAVRREWAFCLVVDNGSEGGPPEHLAREFPAVELVAAGKNLGYAGGNDLGMRIALERGARHLFLLNNDAAVTPGAIDRLRAAVDADTTIAFAGPLVRYDSGAGIVRYAGGEVRRRPFRAAQVLAPEPPPAAGLLPTDYVPGNALFLRREVAEHLGLLDERFFLTWEDTDWAARAARAGLRSVVVAGSEVFHAGSRSFGGAFSPLFSYYYFRNMMLYAGIHFPARERPRAWRDTLGFARVVVRRSRKRGRAAAVAAAAGLGILHFAIGRFGPAPEFLTAAARQARRGRSTGRDLVE